MIRESSLGLRLKNFLQLSFRRNSCSDKNKFMRKEMSIYEAFPATLRTAPLSPDRHTLQRWPSLPRISRSYFVHSIALKFECFECIEDKFWIQLHWRSNVSNVSDDERWLQRVRFSLGGGVWRPWISQPHLSGSSAVKVKWSCFTWYQYFFQWSRSVEEATQSRAT